MFELCGRIIDEFAGLFGEPYPFDKSDHVFVPEFNWGGMENVANITYTDSVVFREPATADQVRRAPSTSPTSSPTCGSATSSR